MNRKMVFYTLSKITGITSLLMLLPTAVCALYSEWQDALAFLAAIIISLVFSGILFVVSKPKDETIYAKEGFVIVSLAWLAISVLGALPFVFSRTIPSFTDAFFETVSGFTTTGSSILPGNVLDNLVANHHGILFWRSFTHWIGGMGVLVFVMAIVSTLSDRSIHIMRAEMPGPIVGKLVPRAKDTSKILYIIYIVMTLAEIILLVCGDMPLFDSVIHAFGTAGTGGFSIRSTGLAEYSAYSQWVIAIFMALFGINFNLYYLIILRRFRSIFKSGELWTYLVIIGISTTLITVNIYNTSLFSTVSETIRTAFFQVSSIITTTGFSTADFNQWPGLSKTILLVLMFIGGCAGSTAGGLKVGRLVILAKRVRKELHQLIHPRSVSVTQFEGKPLDEKTSNTATVYLAIYMAILLLVFLLLSFEPFDIETNLSAAVSCFNNIGPGLSLVGPASSYSLYSAFSKWILSFSMLLGRLEIFPLVLAFSPSTWSRNK